MCTIYPILECTRHVIAVIGRLRQHDKKSECVALAVAATVRFAV